MWIAAGCVALALVAACKEEAPPPPVAVPATTPTPPKPPAPPPAATPAAAADGAVAANAADGGDTGPKSKLAPAVNDGLTLAERMAKKKEEDAKLAAELAAEEKERLLAYDKGKVAKHTALLAFAKKIRKAIDDAAEKNKGDGLAAAMDKLKAKNTSAIAAQMKTVMAIDPKGGNSNLVTDHDVMLNMLNADYPDALAAGDEKAVTEMRAELDKRVTKIEEWLAELKTWKPAKKK